VQSTADTEGIYVDVGPLIYQVQSSRILNPGDEEDRYYLRGLPAGTERLGRGQLWFGIFLRVENQTDRQQMPASSFSIVDTQDKVYHPVLLNDQNVFAYEPKPVPPGGLLPLQNSPAYNSPPSGALLVFKLEYSSYQNRPLELVIEDPRISGRAQVSLDV
jgi:hypothetical protein